MGPFNAIGDIILKCQWAHSYTTSQKSDGPIHMLGPYWLMGPQWVL